MIPDIFDCQYIDEYEGTTSYIECTLTVAIGPYGPDTEINTININHEDGTIELYEFESQEDPSWQGKISYTFTEVTND